MVTEVLERRSGTVGKGTRLGRRQEAPSFESSFWWSLLSSAQAGEDRSLRIFRRRFRLPFQLFRSLVDEFKALRPKSSKDALGRSAVPLELQLLGCLRVLGRGLPYDEAAAQIGCHETTLRCFMLESFLPHLSSEEIVAEHIAGHRKREWTMEEVEEAESMYSKLGVPSVVASGDCVHVPWDMCPAAMRNVYCGKEKAPTLAIEVFCNPGLRIIRHASATHSPRGPSVKQNLVTRGREDPWPISSWTTTRVGRAPFAGWLPGKR
eukprot:scaffold433_cov257-Pinguiococcus_pyrenoidosus.AAC.19